MQQSVLVNPYFADEESILLMGASELLFFSASGSVGLLAMTAGMVDHSVILDNTAWSICRISSRLHCFSNSSAVNISPSLLDDKTARYNTILSFDELVSNSEKLFPLNCSNIIWLSSENLTLRVLPSIVISLVFII